MKNCILFDLDGTLTDPVVGITKSASYALSKFGIEEMDYAKLTCFIGPPLLDAFRDFYGFSQKQSGEALKYYREYFTAGGIFENEVYSGVPEMLDKLRESGCHLYVATSKPEVYARQILEHFNLDEYFEDIVGATLDEKICKKEDIIGIALNRNGNPFSDSTVMVGDRHHDVSGANVYGIETIGVLYGYGSKEELEYAGAKYFADCPEDIYDVIMRPDF